MLRFVILTHDHPHLHWDLMLERDEVLWTWRLSEEPAFNEQITAQRLPDHRTFYLDYEGPVSGDRGTVTLWDIGTYEIESHQDDIIHGVLQGEKLNGNFVLTSDTFRCLLT